MTTSATTVRHRTTSRDPSGHVDWTIGDRVPSALARAAAGKAALIAMAFTCTKHKMFKWFQGESGPELDLARLFPALRKAGVSRFRARAYVEHLVGLFELAYADDPIPALTDPTLHNDESRQDSREDFAQCAIRVPDPEIGDVVRYLHELEADLARKRVVLTSAMQWLREKGVML